MTGHETDDAAAIGSGGCMVIVAVGCVILLMLCVVGCVGVAAIAVR